METATRIEAVIREVLAELGLSSAAAPPAGPCDGGALGPECQPLCRPRVAASAPPFSPRELSAIQAATPARVAQGRAGTRYTTARYINLRAEHANALDAVQSTVPDDFPGALGCVALQSRCADHEEFLRYPDHGRRLDDASRARLVAEGTHGADVQVIAGDGLSAWALLANGPVLLPALLGELRAAGFSVGRPVFVRYARVGVQDEIGVLLAARATAILVGERPGLGTGDSLSIYTAYGPRLNQDNAEKDCLSNIRPLGLPVAEAAPECARLLRRTFTAGGGGVHLTRSGR
jgi:ethanolamine ammonia-lyase small subunit